MSLEDRSAPNVCIFWEESGGVVGEGDRTGSCIAPRYYSADNITCYNDGACDGFGTCWDCSKYDVSGQKFSHLNFSTKPRYEATRVLDDGSTVSYQIETTGSQVPMNLNIFNLRAKFKKCCHWIGNQYPFSMDSSGNLSPIIFPSLTSTEIDAIIAVLLLLEIIDEEASASLQSIVVKIPGVGPLKSVEIENVLKTSDSSTFVDILRDDYDVPSALAQEYAEILQAHNFIFVRDTLVDMLGVDRKSAFSIAQVLVSNSLSILESPLSEEIKKERLTGVINLAITSTKCEVSDAKSWQIAFTTQNPSPHGCNGAKPECPFYTGPKWTYCVDDKMQHGDKISAAQVLELRYYSDDWKSMTDPDTEWSKRFKDPVIWAWSGEFEHPIDSTGLSSSNNPMVQKVEVGILTDEDPTIIISSPVPAELGLSVVEGPTDYPTLIKEISGAPVPIKIAWPKSTSTLPYVFRTFNTSQKFIRIVVDTPYLASLYVVNTTKHPQLGISDSDFIKFMQLQYPDDLHQTDDTLGMGTLVDVAVELEYVPDRVADIETTSTEGLNVIKVFVLDPFSTEESYLTAEAFVRHKFYHAMLAQTKGDNINGYPRIQPWVDKFERVHFEADIMKLSGTTFVDKILWDTTAGGKFTMYPVETLIEEQIQVDWHTLGCNVVAVTFFDNRVNSIMPWKIQGTSTYGVTLSLKVDRKGNGASTEDEVELEILYKSPTGKFMPANVILAKPKGATSAQPRITTALDTRYDIIKATYTVTEYKQGPVVSEDLIRIKYPQYLPYYIDELPLEITESSDGVSFSVDGLFLNITDTEKMETTKLYGIDEVMDELESELKDEESLSEKSFFNGGLQDALIHPSGAVFTQVSDKFNDAHKNDIFYSDSSPVTLQKTCTRFKEMGYHEGSYSFMVIFNDETGRPIGIKRIVMLVQSAMVETRDVEIYYEWKMHRQAWVIIDTQFLLARVSEPMTPALAPGSETYKPKCGDHSETFLAKHSFGTPAPMWYPYIRCDDPKYNQEGEGVSIKCKNFVEGHGQDYEGKRFSYWERMRGPDVLRTVNFGPIFAVGCFWRQVDYNYQTIGEQSFTGYTRIRSAHPDGPFSKDREAIRISRHYTKRNLKVRNETIKNEEDSNIVVWDDTYGQILFDPNQPAGEIRIGSEIETPIWVHINDGVGVVNATTSAVQHPFTHYLMSTASKHAFNEVFSEGRYKLSDVMSERDLTESTLRDPFGNLIYRPGEPQLFDLGERLDDIIPIYKDTNIGWAWLEEPRDPVRGSPQITGIRLYNPSFTYWKKDKESATFSEDGTHALIYTAPYFEDDGTLNRHPSIQWFGGPPRSINWYTGEWVTTVLTDVGSEDFIPYDLTAHISEYPFQLFGKGVDGTAFLADDSGLHIYIASTDSSGTPTYASTFRGLGVNSSITVSELPYTLADWVVDNNGARREIDSGKDNISKTNANNVFTVSLLQGSYVEKVEVTYEVGKDPVEENTIYDIPAISMNVGIVVRDKNGVLTASTTRTLSSSTYIQGASSLVPGWAFVDTREIVYGIGVRCESITMHSTGVRRGRKAKIDTVKIWYRRPEDRVEDVLSYERRLNISSAETGTPDYRDMLYYYSRTIPSFGDSLQFSLFIPDSLPSIKFTSRSVKDVILEYEYYDVTNTRFPYKTEVLPENNLETSEDEDSILSIDTAINICTKGRTLFAGAHKRDVSVENGFFVAPDEDSPCAADVGDMKLDESAQECLYDAAKGLAGNNFTAEFNWFWHPQEIEFWETVGIDDVASKFSPTLTLTSQVAPLRKLWRHEEFGCSSSMSAPYFDGRIHTIPSWQGLGHWIYAGNPLFNETCFEVVLFKVPEHIGERTYGTDDYKDTKLFPSFPWDTPQDASYYQSRGLIEQRGSYTGGSIGGAGIMGFFIAQSQFAHGETAPQTMIRDEVNQQIYAGRIEAARAGAANIGNS